MGGKDVMELKPKERRVVLVAVDKSKEAAYALEWTLEYIAHEGDTLVIFSAVPPVAALFPSDALFMPSEQLTDLEEQLRQEAGVLVHAMAEDARRKCGGLTVVPHCGVGDAREVIVEEARRLHADVLVLGTRGMGTLGRMLVGSVSDHCVHHAPCPTLVVRAPPPSSSSSEDANV